MICYPYIADDISCIIFLDVWSQLCSSCDVSSNPAEEEMGKMTLEKCKKQCEERSDCTAIDYGKNGRNQECYLNYGGMTNYNNHNDFDVYAVTRSGILVH